MFAIALSLLLALPALDVPPLTAAPVATVERTAFLMGTRLELTVEATSEGAALAASEAALDALEATESRLSTWRDDSELSRLNRSPAGEPFSGSSELFDELRAAADCRDLTAGGFDPSVGALVRAWGLRTGGREPARAELDAAVAAVGLDALEFRADGTLSRRRADLVLEEGAFGKGAGLDRALERIAAIPGATAAVLDLGGQVAVWRASRRDRDANRDGDPPAARFDDSADARVAIAVADPQRRDLAVVTLAIDSGSLSTTGSSERGITVGGRHLSHVLDPRTGLPARDLGSVTVWAPNGLLADCLSTGLYVLGLPEIERFTREHPEIGVLVLAAERDAGRRLALANGVLLARLDPLAPDVTVRELGAAAADRSEPVERVDRTDRSERSDRTDATTANEALLPAGGRSRNARAADRDRLSPGEWSAALFSTARYPQRVSVAAEASIHAASRGPAHRERD